MGRPTKVAGTRKWFRSIVESPELREKVQAVIEAGVERGELGDYWKAVEHGFGRPPQALDIKHSQDAPLEFEIKFSDGRLATPETADVSGDPVQ